MAGAHTGAPFPAEAQGYLELHPIPPPIPPPLCHGLLRASPRAGARVDRPHTSSVIRYFCSAVPIVEASLFMDPRFPSSRSPEEILESHDFYWFFHCFLEQDLLVDLWIRGFPLQDLLRRSCKFTISLGFPLFSEQDILRRSCFC